MSDQKFPLVRRGRRNAAYTAIANNLIDHPTLSLGARMALIYLLSKPDDWILQIEDLRRLLGTGVRHCGRDKVYAVINELKASSYVRAVRELNNGRFHKMTYYVFDEPVTDEGASEASPSFSRSPSDAAQRPTDREVPAEVERAAIAPLPKKPDTAKSDPGNQHVTKDRRKQITESPPPPPQSRPRGRTGSEPPDPDLFRKFWAEWPEDERPDNRRFAERLFQRLPASKRELAVTSACAYRAMAGGENGAMRMVPYLREQRFEEFCDAPPIEQRLFVITPERTEWDPWIRYLRATRDEKIVAGQEAKRILRTHTRWPPD